MCATSVAAVAEGMPGARRDDHALAGGRLVPLAARDRNCAVPSIVSKRSSIAGCTWGVTPPPGSIQVSTISDSPVARKLLRIWKTGSTTRSGGSGSIAVLLGSTNLTLVSQATRSYADGVSELSHLDESGSARMVDVGAQAGDASGGRWRARSSRCRPRRPRWCARGDLPEGRRASTARIAGIQAAKRTAELIPLCHPLPLSFVDVDARARRGGGRADRRGAHRRRRRAWRWRR